MLRGAKLLLICAPLALAACASQPSNTSSLEAQVAAANQKADQALATAQQALKEAQQANMQNNRQYQRSLQK
ncbi:MAG: hypothetical protein KGL11_12990 [Alphaproteobacteria bacterium]|nr:hypothetical protein [Alphaproteobacteria bacterium]